MIYHLSLYLFYFLHGDIFSMEMYIIGLEAVFKHTVVWHTFGPVGRYCAVGRLQKLHVSIKMITVKINAKSAK